MNLSEEFFNDMAKKLGMSVDEVKAKYERIKASHSEETKAWARSQINTSSELPDISPEEKWVHNLTMDELIFETDVLAATYFDLCGDGEIEKMIELVFTEYFSRVENHEMVDKAVIGNAVYIMDVFDREPYEEGEDMRYMLSMMETWSKAAGLAARDPEFPAGMLQEKSLVRDNKGAYEEIRKWLRLKKIRKD